MSIDIVTIETSSLGDRSYLAHDGRTALVVDPQRDIDRVLDLTERLGVGVTLVVETRVHNDYVTGGLELATRTGASYVVPAGSGVEYDHVPAGDGDVFTAGGMSVRVLHTPGHTHHHVRYVLEDASAGHGGVVGAATELPAETEVFPTHGFGSFCSATPTSGTASTIGEQVRVNPALTQAEQDYVDTLLAGLGAFPAYYAHMAPLNRRGPAPVDLSLPAPVDADELRRRIEDGEWVVDLRERTAFAAGHLAGSLGFELSGNFVTYLGWLYHYGTPLTLIGQTEEQVARARRELVRIGIDALAGMAVGDVQTLAGGRPLRSYRTSDFAGLAEATAAAPVDHPVQVLDTRRNDERAAGGVRGSLHIPLHQLTDRLGEAPTGEVWIYCGSGYRASVAASVLDGPGRNVVLVNDSYGNAAEAGLESEVAAQG